MSKIECNLSINGTFAQSSDRRIKENIVDANTSTSNIHT